jgi:hypothetical protein
MVQRVVEQDKVPWLRFDRHGRELRPPHAKSVLLPSWVGIVYAVPPLQRLQALLELRQV